MKRNAMLRIVLWSLLALILLGILVTGLFGYVGRNSYRFDTYETAIPSPLASEPTSRLIVSYITNRDTAAYARPDKNSEVTANYPKSTYIISLGITSTPDAQYWVIVDGGYIPKEDLSSVMPGTIIAATATQELPGYGQPVAEGDADFVFPAGSLLTLTEVTSIDGEIWGFESKQNVWVPMELVELGQGDPQNTAQETIPAATAAPTETEPDTPLADRILFDPKQVRNLEIDWAAGSVTIAPSDVGRITISETPVDRPEEALAYTLHGDTLRIRYYEKKTNPSFNHRHSKDLTILVPRDFALDGLSMDTASADLTVTDMNIREADVDGASGRCRFENCQLGSLSVDTVSGDVFVSGTATELDVDSTSAAINAQLTNVPSEISADTVSGNLELTLPENAGYTMELETLSGNFRSDFDTTKNGSVYRSGDGRCEIEVDSVSGDVTIRKG